MKRFLLTSVIAIALAMIAGCEGGDAVPTDGGPEQGDIGSGVPIDPFFVSGPDCEADPAAAGCDTAPIVEHDCTKDPTAAGCPKFRADRIDIQPKKRLPDGTVGEFYEEEIKADGSTGPFSFQAEGLPLGLSIDESSGVISGTPTEIGKFRPAITVTDSKGTEEEKKLSLIIRGAIGLKVSQKVSGDWIELQGDPPSDWWLRLYKIEVVGEDDEYTWEVNAGDRANVCFTSVVPDKDDGPDRKNCSSDAQGSKVMYLYLKENKPDADPLTVQVEVEGDFSDPESLTQNFTFEFSKEQEPSPDPPVEETPESESIQEIKVVLKTADKEGAGTDALIQIKFCKDPALRDCKGFYDLDRSITNPRDANERGQADEYHLKFKESSGLTMEYRKHFQIRSVRGKGSNEWLIQGLSVWVKAKGQGDFALVYRNPCKLKWMAVGDHLSMHEEDTAVCAVSYTSLNEDDPGTDDDVYLVFDSKKPAKHNYLSKDCDNDPNAPCLKYYSKGYRDGQRRHALSFSWGNYSDCNEGDKTSYGDYFNDSNPFTDDNGDPSETIGFQLRKHGDDGWLPAHLWVFVFQPGKIMKNDDGSYFYDVSYFSSRDIGVWIDEDGDPTTTAYPRGDWAPMKRSHPGVRVADSFDFGGYF